MFQRYTLYFAWLLACAGTIGSLYFSEIRNMTPCTLCWLQRISLFPLAIILGIATYRGDRSIAFYALPLVFLGALFAAYQIAIQEIPGWNPIDICGSGPSCSTKHYIGVGFITIPMLSLLNFLVMGGLLFYQFPKQR